MIADNLLIKRSHSRHLTVMFENRHILLGQLTSNSHEIKNALIYLQNSVELRNSLYYKDFLLRYCNLEKTVLSY